MLDLSCIWQSLRFDFLGAPSTGILLDVLNYGILTESSKHGVVYVRDIHGCVKGSDGPRHAIHVGSLHRIKRMYY